MPYAFLDQGDELLVISSKTAQPVRIRRVPRAGQTACLLDRDVWASLWLGRRVDNML